MTADGLVEVEAYAGVNYPERPLRVHWQGAWRRVLSLEHQHQEPDRRCFIVLLDGDTCLRLCYHYANNIWRAEPFAGHRED